jgi:hypothetical protein
LLKNLKASDRAELGSRGTRERLAEKGERPVGVPAARGHGGDGGAETRGARRRPNCRAPRRAPNPQRLCREGVTAYIARSVQFFPVRRYLSQSSLDFRWPSGSGQARAEEVERWLGRWYPRVSSWLSPPRETALGTARRFHWALPEQNSIARRPWRHKRWR